MQKMDNSMFKELGVMSKKIPEINDLLSIIRMVESKRFLTLGSQDRLDGYARYIEYRVQQDFYDLGRECGEFCDMSWDDFAKFMCQCKPAQMAASIVVRETLKNLYQCPQFNFDATEVNLNMAKEQGEVIHFSTLFSRLEGIGLVDSILLCVELAQYKRQLNQGSDCSWLEFLAQLEENSTLWNQVLMAFLDALARLDFKPIWQSEKSWELLKQAESQEA